jgi:F-type H+-transporting ATPase subunit b
MRNGTLRVVIALASAVIVSAMTPAICAAAGGGEGVQTYDKLTIDAGSMVLTIIVFIALLVVLRAFAWKPIQEVIQRREQFIEESLAQARHEREEAERLFRQYTEQVNKAREEATAIVEEGRRDAEVVRRRIHEEARVEANVMIERARREIEIARDDAVKELYGRAVDLASLMAGRIVKRELRPDDHRALVDEALAEIGRESPMTDRRRGS